MKQSVYDGHSSQMSLSGCPHKSRDLVKLWPCQFLYIEGFFLAFPQAISFGCHCAPGWWVLSW